MQAEMKQAYQKSGLAPKKDSKTMQTGGGAGGLSGFWKFAVLFSFLVNAILVLVLLVVVGLIFQIKNGIAAPLIGGLYDNFVLMDDAHIVSAIAVNDTIQVNDTIPVVFDLPLNQETAVILTQDTPVSGATIFLNGAAIPINVILPQGTPLNIRLNMTVPVSQTVPVVLNVPVHLQVPVDIPLNRTQLHQPFANLAQLVAPYNALLNALPSDWSGIFSGP